MEYPLSEKEFRCIYAKVPRLCVDLIVRDGKKVLLTKRKIDPYKGFWHLPGGTVYFGETLEQAVKRVAKGELNLDVEIKTLHGYVEFSDEYKGSWRGWPVSLDFEVTVLGGEIIGGDQAEEFKFFDQIPAKTVAPHIKFITEKLGLKRES